MSFNRDKPTIDQIYYLLWILALKEKEYLRYQAFHSWLVQFKLGE
jgi:hypothetical protein